MAGYGNDPHGDRYGWRGRPGYGDYGYQQPGDGHGQPGGYGRPPRPGRNWKMIGIIGGIALAVIVAVAAIAAIANTGSQRADPTAVTSPLPTPTAASPVPTTEASPQTAAVPDVVGKDLQSAQEELFPPLRSTSVDATGQERRQFVDSNWVVVRQEPAAGSVVPVLTDIKLFVVKAAEASPAGTSAEESTPPLTATVPDVVGKDLQSAQEELFPPLRSTSVDATGQGRSQIIDSNWVVIRQEPAAGTVVPVLTDIKLFVVKQGERS